MSAKKKSRVRPARSGPRAGATKTKTSKPNAGISRIDQPEKRTFGFFVRLMRKGKIHNAFFADRTHGGKKSALLAARKHYKKLVHQLGPVVRRRR